MKITPFNPSKAELQKVVERIKGVKIENVEDKAGYLLAKESKKELAKYRIAISKFGKQQREEAIAWQREVLKQEKELIGIIEPFENDLKEQIEKIDMEKAREERKILLPTRKALLKEINIKMSDDEILDLDEKSFAEHYSQLKNDYEFELEEKKREKARKERMKKQIEEARQEEREKAEKVKIEAIRRAKEEAMAKAKQDESKALELENERLRAIEEDKKNAKYQEWIKKMNLSKDDKIERVGNKFVAYKKVGEIII